MGRIKITVWSSRGLAAAILLSFISLATSATVGESEFHLRQPGAGMMPDPTAPPRPPTTLRPGESYFEPATGTLFRLVPGGSFRMGDLADAGYSDEKPVRTVSIRPFYLGQYEVTFREWDQCVAEGACSHSPDDRDWGRGDRPVIDVSWQDVQEYIRWLNLKTGKFYRLPSEAEWEYAARAGSTTPYSWGEVPSGEHANGNEKYGWPEDGYDKSTAPVGSFEANPWGIHDMLGNVWEWVQDCWHRNYHAAPLNGAAWTGGGCTKRVGRGGGWIDGAGGLRVSGRHGGPVDLRGRSIGFRLARDAH